MNTAYWRKIGAKGGRKGWRNNREKRLKQLAYARAVQADARKKLSRRNDATGK